MNRATTIALLSIAVLFNSTKCDMQWKTIFNRSALCNDFTPAGFFVEEIDNSQKWLIFLESGGSCYSYTSCINRYFRDTVRSDSTYQGLDGHFSPIKAKSSALAFDKLVSPLVTSMLTFSNTSYFPSGDLNITGLGLLDRNCTLNPVFCTYNYVLLPYCSSDLWIADGPPPPNCTIPPAMYDACYNDGGGDTCRQIGEKFYKECFLSNHSGLPFLYRGSVIFREAIKQLPLDDAAEVILAGSSAGGVGAVNQAKWLYEYLKINATNSSLKVIIDSAWFINFQDNIYKTFFGLVNHFSGEGIDGLLSTFQSTEEMSAACNDLNYGSPCCLSAYCMLTNSSYYPYTEVPTFAIISLYDVYLLANALSELPGISQNTIQNDAFLPYVQIVQEYGGAMNTSISLAANRAGKFSYIVSECFQHIYFVTSTLWGEGRVLGTQSVEINKDIGSFRHTMDPDVWRIMKLSGGITISDALVMWNTNHSEQNQVLTIRDSCYSPHCNSKCPEKFLVHLGGANWALPIKGLLICIVIGITVVCLIFKALFSIWLHILMKKQKEYQRTLASDNTDDLHEFPQCQESQTVSIACKNLSYSINLKPERIKDEKNDITHPIVLGGLDDKEFTLSMSYRQEDTNLQNPKMMQVEALGEDTEKNTFCCKTLKHTNKKILRSVSTYFSSGELIGIMGPSGCGKTTLLDLLTGRRQPTEGQVFINGVPMNDIRSWYAARTGYVLQLASPYYEKLTVRENLILASQIKLSASFNSQQKFERVDEVMGVTGLLPVADTIVGSVTGPGLSGGQKRRLTVALQLLNLPSVIILDEPTSGLDSSSSFELLTHLNKLTDTNRTVIVTIHQPRLEIYHLFHKLILLTEGKIAYHGVPDKAYEVFVTALKTRCLEQGYIIPEVEDHNPADVIMDMLGNPTVREIITEYYQHSGEQTRILELLEKTRMNNANAALLQFVNEQNNDGSGLLTRLAALEARNAKQGGIWQLLYLPCLFLGYGFLLGTAYWQAQKSFLVLSGFCVYSVASALFMFPALNAFFQKALEVYRYEHSDGICRPWDLVLQGFIKAVFMSIVPVIICAGVLYLLLVDSKTYSWRVFGQILVVNMALNQTWIALLIFLICTFPKLCARLSPVISSVAGFASGFFIPRDTMPLYYRWICYINPNYYGLSASAKLLLNDYNATCTDQNTVFQCFTTSGAYVLRQFNMDDANPYFNITILLCFTLFYLLAAIVCNALNNSSLEILWPFHKRTKRFKTERPEILSNNVAIELEPLGDETNIQGSSTARRRWKTAGKIFLEQVAQNKSASLDQMKFTSPFSEDTRTNTIPEGSVTGEAVPLKPKYLRTISKIQERQKRLARQVSTTVEVLKSIEESVVTKILQNPDNPRHTYIDATKIYQDELTQSITTGVKYHRPPRRSTVGDIPRPVKIASLRLHGQQQTSFQMDRDTTETETVNLEPMKHLLPTVEICIEEPTN